MLSISKVAEFLGLGLPQIKNLLSSGKLTGMMQGGEQMIDPSSLVNLVNSDDKFASLRGKLGDLPGMPDMPDMNAEGFEVDMPGVSKPDMDMPKMDAPKMERPSMDRPSVDAPSGGLPGWLFPLLGLIALGIIGWLALSSCGGDDENAGVGKSCSEVEVGDDFNLGGCTLTVAVENAYQPFSFIDIDSGDAVGYDYDIFDAICGELNCVPEFHETSWDAMVAIMGGTGDFTAFDVGADGITITDERAQFVDFSDPYINLAQVILVRADEGRFIEGADMAGDGNLLIGSQPGTTNYDTAVDLVGEDRIVAYDSFGTAVQALINGDVDAVVMDNVAGQGYVGANPDDIKITGGNLTSEDLGFIFAKNSPLTGAVNHALSNLDTSGTLADIYDTWFVTE